ncbi:hypothetical protein Tco_0486921 [Tanacetum coccineum]
MAASAIIISSDSSDESVGSPPSRVILFGDIPTVIPSTSVVAPETSTIAPVISSAAPVVETTLVASPTGLCGLVPYTGSDSDSPDEGLDSSDGHTYRRTLILLPLFSLEEHATLIRPGEAIPFGRPYRTHPNGPRKLCDLQEKRVRPLPACRLASRHASPRSPDHHSSSSSSSSDSSPVHSLGLDAPDQAHSGSSTREVGDHVGIDNRDYRDDTEEYEADASTEGTAEAGQIEDTPVDLSDVVRDFYHHMSEVRVDRIVGIETAQGQLEADQLIASGDKARMAEAIYSLRGVRQIRRDRDDARGRLRRLELYLWETFLASSIV